MPAYHVIRINDDSYRYEYTVEGKPAIPPPDFHCIYVPALHEYGEPVDGSVWDSLNKRFVLPGFSDARTLTKYQFMSRLGFPAITNIRTASKTDVEIETAWEFAVAAEYVSLDDAMTATLLGLLATKNVITADDVETILDGGTL